MLSARISLFVLLLLAIMTTARQYSTNVNIPAFRRQDSWVFVDRMHVYPGKMAVIATVALKATKYKQKANYEMELVAVPNSIWEIALKAKCDASKRAKDESLLQSSQKIFPIILDEYKGYKYTISSELSIQSEQTFSFILRDCSKKMINDGYGRDTKIDIALSVRNNDSNIGAGEQWYGILLPLLLLCSLGMLYLLHRQKQEEGDNWIKITLKVSLWIGVGSISSKYIGFLVYRYGAGQEYGVFDIFYLLLHGISDSVVMVLLMLLSYGWTVTFKNARDFDLYVPLACMLGLVNVIMTMLNKISDGEHDKYHMYDTIPAYIMIGFRMVAFITFIVGIARSWYNLKKGPEQHRIRNYLQQMTVLGIIYLAFVPVGFVVMRFVDARYRKQGMFFGVQLVRFGMSYWLGVLGVWKKSAYRSIIDQSFMEKGDKFY